MAKKREGRCNQLEQNKWRPSNTTSSRLSKWGAYHESGGIHTTSLHILLLSAVHLSTVKFITRCYSRHVCPSVVREPSTKRCTITKRRTMTKLQSESTTSSWTSRYWTKDGRWVRWRAPGNEEWSLPTISRLCEHRMQSQGTIPYG